MYDKQKVITGLIIFLGLLLSPLAYNMVAGSAGEKPVLELPDPGTEEGKQCVESKLEMRQSHMQILFDWRETVVRGSARVYQASDGKTYNMSITMNCLNCHDNKEKFCDQCHDYLKVKPYCWDCHIIPKKESV